MVEFFKAADASSAPHEMYHIFRRIMSEMYEDPNASEASKERYRKACEFVGTEPGRAWTVEQEEKFARAGERFLLEGVTPTPQMGDVLESFRQWIAEIYGKAERSGLEISDGMREVFGGMMGTAEDGDRNFRYAMGRLLDYRPEAGLDTHVELPKGAFPDRMIEAYTADSTAEVKEAFNALADSPQVQKVFQQAYEADMAAADALVAGERAEPAQAGPQEKKGTGCAIPGSNCPGRTHGRSRETGYSRKAGEVKPENGRRPDFPPGFRERLRCSRTGRRQYGEGGMAVPAAGNKTPDLPRAGNAPPQDRTEDGPGASRFMDAVSASWVRLPAPEQSVFSDGQGRSREAPAGPADEKSRRPGGSAGSPAFGFAVGRFCEKRPVAAPQKSTPGGAAECRKATFFHDRRFQEGRRRMPECSGRLSGEKEARRLWKRRKRRTGGESCRGVCGTFLPCVTIFLAEAGGVPVLLALWSGRQRCSVAGSLSVVFSALRPGRRRMLYDRPLRPVPVRTAGGGQTVGDDGTLLA